MSLTERKRCDKCKVAGQRTTFSLFLKENPAENIEEECLNCGWRDEEEFYTNRISEVGFDQAKQEWENNRDCQLNKDIEREMDFWEKAQWEKFKEKNNKLFAPKTYTERKHCDICQQKTVHLKENPAENLVEECLPCGWYDIDENGKDKWWNEKIEEVGLEKAKEEWEANRDSELNQRIIAELTPKENKEWEVFKNRIETLFLEKKEEKEKPNKERESQELDYQPYLIGGAIGGGIIAFIWLIVFLIRKDYKKT